MPEAFAWYTVDVTYDIPSGTYDLVIRREGSDAPLVSLRHQPNTIQEAGSAIDKFSFVGSPFTDRSKVVYYVDDVVIGTDESVARAPLVAPGRRKLFVDSFVEYQLLLRERPRCLPPLDPEDLGFTPDDLAEVQAAGLSDVVAGLLAGAEDRSGRRRRSAEAKPGAACWTRPGRGAKAATRSRPATRRRPSSTSSGPRTTPRGAGSSASLPPSP